MMIYLLLQQLDWDQLLEAVRIGNIVTVERLINTRYIDVNATFGVRYSTGMLYAAYISLSYHILKGRYISGIIALIAQECVNEKWR